MVGDHPLDIHTGKCAGARTAGVTSGNTSAEDFGRSGADWIARDCDALITQLIEDRIIA
jgi:phosphoglycolate phosphatase